MEQLEGLADVAFLDGGAEASGQHRRWSLTPRALAALAGAARGGDTGRAMSQENVEIVRRGFEHANRRDVDGFLTYLDPEFELRSAVVGGAEGNVYRGPDGVRQWLANLDETFEELINEPIELRDLGDRVLAFGRIRARGRESGLNLDSPTGWVFTLRDGKLVAAEGFMSRAEALEAVRLRE